MLARKAAHGCDENPLDTCLTSVTVLHHIRKISRQSSPFDLEMVELHGAIPSYKLTHTLTVVILYMGIVSRVVIGQEYGGAVQWAALREFERFIIYSMRLGESSRAESSKSTSRGRVVLRTDRCMTLYGNVWISL